MKYVMMEVRVKGDDPVTIHVPFIFPNAQVHADVARAAQGLLIRQYPGAQVRPVSAGTYSVNIQECSGGSETLGLQSRGNVDSRIIQTNNYCHGIQ